MKIPMERLVSFFNMNIKNQDQSLTVAILDTSSIIKRHAFCNWDQTGLTNQKNEIYGRF